MIGRKKELSFLKNGLGRNGSLRCAFINGDQGIGKTTLLENLCSHLIAKGNHLMISANGRDCKNSDELLTNFTRNLLSSEHLEFGKALNQFARKICYRSIVS